MKITGYRIKSGEFNGLYYRNTVVYTMEKITKNEKFGDKEVAGVSVETYKLKKTDDNTENIIRDAYANKKEIEFTFDKYGNAVGIFFK